MRDITFIQERRHHEAANSVRFQLGQLVTEDRVEIKGSQLEIDIDKFPAIRKKKELPWIYCQFAIHI